MRKAQAASAVNQPLVTPTEVRRFDKAVTVRDRGAFLFELDRLVREKLAAATHVADETTMRPVVRSTAMTDQVACATRGAAASRKSAATARRKRERMRT